MIAEQSWGFAQIWNESLEIDKEKTLEPRQRIWASEIGGSLVDRYLKMKGVKPTNPPNARSRRKFEAGNIWEHIVGYVLKRAGILIESQEWLKYEYPGLLPVSGKLDFIAGGNPDYDKASYALKEVDWLPPFVSLAALNIVDKLKKQFPNGLKNIILEIKSCSSFMFDNYEKSENASPQHKCQNFHYLKAKDMPEGHIVYISKDDARILEIGVFNPSVVENDYKEDIIAISNYIQNDVHPPLEKSISYDSGFMKFSVNWKVAYSPYLTMLYGFQNQMEFDEKYKPIVERWNRVLVRFQEGKTLTDNNKEAIEEMRENGFEIENLKV